MVTESAPTVLAPDMPAEVHAGLLRAHVIEVITRAARNDPRSLQKALGPSDLGDECVRKIGYKLLDVEPANPGDPWPTTVGHAVHTWLADTFLAEEQRRPGRYLIEQRVDPGGNPGSNDLFVNGPGSPLDEMSAAEEAAVLRVLDKLTGTVTDWKCKGVNGMKRLRAHPVPSQVYRVQLHLYGLGQERAGQDVRWVSIVSLPKAGKLSEAHVWSEPYNRAVAEWALTRREQIETTLGGFEVYDHPERIGVLPATPSPLCGWCDYFRPGSTDLARGCPGETLLKGK